MIKLPCWKGFVVTAMRGRDSRDSGRGIGVTDCTPMNRKRLTNYTAADVGGVANAFG